MSNRCGHKKNKFRLCDTVKRGRGGQPRVLGVISGKLSRAATDRRVLKDLQYHSGELSWVRRGRRSEIREVAIAVMQYLSANWLQLETCRCAVPGTEFLECPDANHIRLKIQASPDWKGSRLSIGRVYSALNLLEKAGYIRRSAQKREQLANGLWIGSPKIIRFTKFFFHELGGKRLWRWVRHSGSLKLAKMRHRLARTLSPGEDPRRDTNRTSTKFNP